MLGPLIDHALCLAGGGVAVKGSPVSPSSSALGNVSAI